MHLQIAGLLLVLGVLAYLWVVLSRLGRAVHALERRMAPAAPAPTATGAAAPAALDAGVVAAIAAAVAVVIRGRHRIVAVRPESSAQRAWSAEGRREIYLSHRVR